MFHTSPKDLQPWQHLSSQAGAGWVTEPPAMQKKHPGPLGWEMGSQGTDEKKGKIKALERWVVGGVRCCLSKGKASHRMDKATFL